MKEVYASQQPYPTTASYFKRYPLFSQSEIDLVRRMEHGKQQDHWQQGRNGGVEDVAEQFHRRKIEDSCREHIVTNGRTEKANLGACSIRSIQSPSGRPYQRSVKNRGGQRTSPGKRQEKVGGFEVDRSRAHDHFILGPDNSSVGSIQRFAARQQLTLWAAGTPRESEPVPRRARRIGEASHGDGGNMQILHITYPIIVSVCSLCRIWTGCPPAAQTPLR